MSSYICTLLLSIYWGYKDFRVLEITNINNYVKPIFIILLTVHSCEFKIFFNICIFLQWLIYAQVCHRQYLDLVKLFSYVLLSGNPSLPKCTSGRDSLDFFLWRHLKTFIQNTYFNFYSAYSPKSYCRFVRQNSKCWSTNNIVCGLILIKKISILFKPAQWLVP